MSAAQSSASTPHLRARGLRERGRGFALIAHEAVDRRALRLLPRIRLAHVLGGATAALFSLATILAITGAGRSDVGAVVLQVSSMTLLAGTALSCLARGALRSVERMAWLAIGLAFVAWFAGDFVYWTSALPPIASDVAYLTFYGIAALGVALLVRAQGVRGDSVVDAGIAVAGMATIWAWLVWDAIQPAGGDSTVVMTMYPVADLVLAAAAVGAMQATRWGLRSRWVPIMIGFAAVALADSVWLVASANGTYLDGTPVDLVWPAGAVCVGAAAWLRVPERRDESFATGAAPLIIAGSAGLAALVVIVADQFEDVGRVALSAAIATVVLGGIRACAAHFHVLAGERALRLAAFRTVHALATAVDVRDHYTRDHSSQVSRYARAIASRMGATDADVEQLAIAGELHDIGKIAVPDAILLKNGPLTPDEFEAIERHPHEGERIVENAGLARIAPWIRHHHERWDGLGYPDKLCGEGIPVGARILGLADALDAMTTDRSYRTKLTIAEARAEIARGAARQFDPALADIVLAMIDEGVLPAAAAPLGHDSE